MTARHAASVRAASCNVRKVRKVRTLLAFALPMALALSVSAQGVSASISGSIDAGLQVGRTVGADQLGMPLYPGAVLQRNKEDEDNSVSMSLWGGSLGIKIAAATYRSADEVERIGRFYRDALARNGQVLDCGAADAPRGESREPGPLTCGKDKPEPGGRLYKVGTPKNFRVIGIKRLAGGEVEIGMARVEIR